VTISRSSHVTAWPHNGRGRPLDDPASYPCPHAASAVLVMALGLVGMVAGDVRGGLR
jgi:hypothetical protein